MKVDLHHGADGASGPVFQLWGSFTIPKRGQAVLTQTGPHFNFDTSDDPFEPVGTPAPAGDPRIPTVTVAVRGSKLTHLDKGHVLDTLGFDAFFGQPNESTQWTSVGRAPCKGADVELGPRGQTDSVRGSARLTLTLTNSCGEPLTDVRVRFVILSGPNAHHSRFAVTDDNGHASFRYSSSAKGTDKVRCTVTNPAGTFSASAFGPDPQVTGPRS